MTKKPLVVNLFGGPGSGKSTTRAGIFHLLKCAGVSCEEAPEWIKSKVYEGNPYVPTDQIYIFAKQRKKLLEIGQQVDVIITDSPLLLSLIYGQNLSVNLRTLIVEEFESFNNLNYLIERTKPYDRTGRYQTEEEAKEKDHLIRGLLLYNGYRFKPIDGNKKAAEEIAADIIKKLEKEGK